MKRSFRSLLFFALAASFLTVTAFADMGPKDQLAVKVVNAPEEPYYLDILAEGNYEDSEDLFDGLEWSYSGGEAAALDQDLLEALRAAVPEGWHACTAEGSTGAPMWGDLYPNADGVHIFGYHGVPDTYRILMVTKSGQVFLSGVCVRTVLQSSATVDWAAKTVTIPPTWVGYVLQFLATFVPTILVEGILLLLFGYGTQRRNWLRFLTVNLLTQGTLALAMAYSAMQHGVTGWSLLPFIFMEILIIIGEAALYSHLLTGHSRGRAVLYGLAANLCSALLGLHLAEPVWKFVVSIS